MNRQRAAKPMSSRRVCACGGFTLLEMMIVMMILATIAIIFAGSVVFAEKAAHINGQYGQAISLCQHKIDQCRAVGWGRLTFEELNDAGVVDDLPTTSPFSFAAVDDVAQYLPSPSVCSVAVSAHPGNPSVSVVTVTLTWRNARHRTKTSTVSLSAQIANVE